ncbi:formin-like protein 5 [Pollicipes pollicipes]|uniref:formin-like protein 5 n=1 Tax=Pollicipes pollicipes TaxID=41117 RepID=UPI0018854CAB|nr:formin-like protein 5 [Pollicipes pollicipes]
MVPPNRRPSNPTAPPLATPNSSSLHRTLQAPPPPPPGLKPSASAGQLPSRSVPSSPQPGQRVALKPSHSSSTLRREAPQAPPAAGRSYLVSNGTATVGRKFTAPAVRPALNPRPAVAPLRPPAIKPPPPPKSPSVQGLGSGPPSLCGRADR